MSDTTVAPPTSTVSRRSNTTANITLYCTAEGNPLPRISWIMNNSSFNGVQEVTGFMETAASSLTLSVGELSLGLNSVECIATVDAVTPALVENAVATVTVEGTNSKRCAWCVLITASV